MASRTSRSRAELLRGGVVALALAVALAASGCMSAKRAYPGRDDGMVWTALVASAHTPEYASEDVAWKWRVTRNEVWADPVGQRIEIYRQLDRTVRVPMTAPRHEERTWRFAISLESDEDAPVARFAPRGFALPLDARAEADRYFRGVAAVLSPQEQPDPNVMKPFLRDDQSVADDAFVPAVGPRETAPPPAVRPDPVPPPVPPARPVEIPTPEPEPEEEVDPALLDLLDEPG